MESDQIPEWGWHWVNPGPQPDALTCISSKYVTCLSAPSTSSATTATEAITETHLSTAMDLPPVHAPMEVMMASAIGRDCQNLV